MVSHFLSAGGFEVVATSDGDEAIIEAKHIKYDVILLDVTMERVDGMEAAHEIRNKINKNQDTPIIGLTGRSEPDEILKCEDAGMDLVLTKPVDLEQLIDVLLNIERCEFEDYRDDLHKEQEISNSNILKIIDIDVLKKYKELAGTASVEGVLHDFSDQWPRKIGELYTSLVNADLIAFARANEELSVLAAGIGAGKLAHYSSIASSCDNVDKMKTFMPDIVNACQEVQTIVTGLKS